MKYATILILLCGLALGQTAKPHPKAAPSCTANLKDVSAERDALKSQLAALQTQNEQITKDKIDTQARLDAALKMLEDIKVAGREVLNYTAALEAEYTKTVASYNQLTDRYNALLMNANQQLTIANERLARRERIANALAIYSMMPKYTPVQMPPPPVLNVAPIPPSIHCTSNNLGSTTFTDCH